MYAFILLQLGLKFPKADGAAAIVDTSLYDAHMLTPGPASAGPYPLAVRLETITAKGLADGHTLQVIALPMQTQGLAAGPCMHRELTVFCLLVTPNGSLFGIAISLYCCTVVCLLTICCFLYLLSHGIAAGGHQSVGECHPAPGIVLGGRCG